MPTLFDPIQLGAIRAPNRVVMDGIEQGWHGDSLRDARA
jgi:2,4-dienoyl-CoA reductase-like NADH-dependent reductase (Old Yellow Enzyme family)